MSQPGTVRLVIDDIEARRGEDIVVPILADASFPITAFGFDLAFPSDFLAFVQAERTDYTEKFDEIGANPISEGMVRVGGFTTQEAATPSPAVLVTLVFRVIGEVQPRTSLSITNAFDDLSHAQVQTGIIRRQMENSPQVGSGVRKTGGRS